MLDVNAVVQVLWDKSLQSNATHFVAEMLQINEITSKTLVSYWAGLHDIGKVSPGFQGKNIFAYEELSKLGFAFNANDPGHGITSTIILREHLKEGMDNSLANNLATALGGHHGTFPCSSDINNSQHLRGNAKWQENQTIIFNRYTDICNINSSKPNKITASPGHPFYLFLAGLTSVADWIASNEEFFPYKINHNVEKHLEYALIQACKAISSLHWDQWHPSSAPLNFQDIFNFNEIRPLQEEAIKLASKLNQKPELVIIEAPMGEGKTEAAIYLADSWATNLKQKGCYFALPSMATSNQMFDRIKQFISQRYPESTINLMLLHGHASLSAEFDAMITRDAPFKINGIAGDDGYDQTPAGIIATEWFTHRKRGLLTPFGVGTIDQILLAVLQTRHVFVRLFGLANKTIIIDEVHAYDTYMTTLLERLLEWLAALGSSVVMLSATLPEARRKKLEEAYIKGLSGTKPPNIQSDEQALYPRISWTEEHSMQEKHISISPQSSKRLMLQWVNGNIPENYNDFELGKYLQNILSNGGQTAIICNTVNQAQKIYLALKPFFPENASDGQPVLDLLHARYLFGDRQKREERSLIRFGKPNGKVKCSNGLEHPVKRPDKSVLVSTQIIEQSLDLDFDLMVTEMAPLDFLLQRSGRMHRHQRKRPDNFANPSLLILKPEIKDGVPYFGSGTEAVYDYHILLRSWLEIINRSEIKIPEDIEALIEAIYDDDRQCPHNISEEIKMKWADSKNQLKLEVENEISEAQDRWIKHPWFSQELWRISSKPREEDNPELHKAHQALTRLSNLTINIICLFGDDTTAFLDIAKLKPLDLNTQPDTNTTRELLMHSVPISHKGVAIKIINEGKKIPLSWHNQPLLRHHYILFFDENEQCRLDKYILTLDHDIGLIINQTN